jgi:5-formyltetrahydrofolate cyclo-ligase
MQDLKEKKAEIRNKTLSLRDALSDSQRKDKSDKIMDRLFEFANFVEAKIVLFYMNTDHEVNTVDMIRKAMEYEKGIVLPYVDKKEKQIIPLKIDDLDSDLQSGYRKILEPIPQRCKQMPVEQIDLAIIPGIAFDERGGRIGHGTGFYDKLIPKLEITTRKVALAFECQIVPQIPMEPHDRHIDIIVTEKRIIYKI